MGKPRGPSPQTKINVTSKSPVGDISVVTLLRTDATLDHSQKAEKVTVWGVLTCLFVLSRYEGPKIFFACGAPRIPLEISKETVFSLQCFSFGPGAVLGGAYMLVRHHACSSQGVCLAPSGPTVG